MTARFGRNKRRAARAAIAALEHEVFLFDTALEVLREKLTEEQNRRRESEGLLGEISERLRRAVGVKTGLLPIELLPKPHGQRDPWARKEPVPRDLDGYIALSAEPGPISLDIRNDVETLLRLVIVVERHPDQFRRIIRFFDSDDGPHPKFSTRAMWVSEDMLRTVGIMGTDLHRLSHDIARRLVELPARDGRVAS